MPKQKKKPTRYPWDKWLARTRSFSLRKGIDYGCQTHSMAQQLRNAAGLYDLRVSVKINGDVLTVKVLPKKKKKKV